MTTFRNLAVSNLPHSAGFLNAYPVAYWLERLGLKIEAPIAIRGLEIHHFITAQSFIALEHLLCQSLSFNQRALLSTISFSIPDYTPYDSCAWGGWSFDFNGQHYQGDILFYKADPRSFDESYLILAQFPFESLFSLSPIATYYSVSLDEDGATRSRGFRFASPPNTLTRLRQYSKYPSDWMARCLHGPIQLQWETQHRLFSDVQWQKGSCSLFYQSFSFAFPNPYWQMQYQVSSTGQNIPSSSYFDTTYPYWFNACLDSGTFIAHNPEHYRFEVLKTLPRDHPFYLIINPPQQSLMPIPLYPTEMFFFGHSSARKLQWHFSELFLSYEAWLTDTKACSDALKTWLYTHPVSYEKEQWKFSPLPSYADLSSAIELRAFCCDSGEKT